MQISTRIFDEGRLANDNPRFIDIEKLEGGKIRFRVHARNGYKSVILTPESARKVVDSLNEFLSQ